MPDDFLDSLIIKITEISNKLKAQYLYEHEKQIIKRIKELEDKTRDLLQEKGIRAFGYNTGSNNNAIYEQLNEYNSKLRLVLNYYISNNLESIQNIELERIESENETDENYIDKSKIQIEIQEEFENYSEEFLSYIEHFLKVIGYSENTIEDIQLEYNKKIKKNVLEKIQNILSQAFFNDMSKFRNDIRDQEKLLKLRIENTTDDDILSESEIELLRKAKIVSELKLKISELETKTEEINLNNIADKKRVYI